MPGSTSTTKTRSFDGCNNCKDGRIKCDRLKPTCSICKRRGLDCDYSLRLKWVDNDALGTTFNPNEEYRAPRLKRTRRSKFDISKNTSLKVIKPKKNRKPAYIKSTPALSKEASELICQFQKKQKMLTGLDASPNTTSPTFLFNLEKVPMKSMFHTIDFSTDLAESSSNDSQLTVSLDGNEEICSLDPLSKSLDLSLMRHTQTSYIQELDTSLLSTTCTKTVSLRSHSDHDMDSKLLNSMSLADLDHYAASIFLHHPLLHKALGITAHISNHLSDPFVHGIFYHYVEFTCPSLDPERPNIHSNNSIKHFLPLAINFPSTFHGLLALSCLQLSGRDPQYLEHALRHRSISIKYLSQQILKEKNALRNPSILSAVICQITLDVMDVKSVEWRSYLEVCRPYIKETLALDKSQDHSLIHKSSRHPNYNAQVGTTIWFLAIRAAKYDTFGCLIDCHKPIIHIRVFDQNPTLEPQIDAVWGLPARWALLCAHLQHWGRILIKAEEQKPSQNAVKGQINRPPGLDVNQDNFHSSEVNNSDEDNSCDPNVSVPSSALAVLARQEMIYVCKYIERHRPLQTHSSGNSKQDVEGLWKLATSMMYHLLTLCGHPLLTPQKAEETDAEDDKPSVDETLWKDLSWIDREEALEPYLTNTHYSRDSRSCKENHRVTYFRPDEIPQIQSDLVSAISILCDFPVTDFLGTALSWPLFIFTVCAFREDQRSLIAQVLRGLYANLRITTFGEILSTAQDVWFRWVDPSDTTCYNVFTGEGLSEEDLGNDFGMENVTAFEYREAVKQHFTILFA